MRVDDQQIPLQMPIPALLTQRQTVNLSDRADAMHCDWFTLCGYDLYCAVHATGFATALCDSIVHAG